MTSKSSSLNSVASSTDLVVTEDDKIDSDIEADILNINLGM